MLACVEEVCDRTVRKNIISMRTAAAIARRELSILAAQQTDAVVACSGSGVMIEKEFSLMAGRKGDTFIWWFRG